MGDESQKNRRWRSSPDISTELQQNLSIVSIREAATVRTFFRNALFANDYAASPEWERIVALSPAGEEAIRLSGLSPSTKLPKQELMMAIFCLFYHHELFIDCDKCDIKAARELLNTELLAGRLQFPHQFGRLLYDKFNDTYSGDRTDHLLPDEALRLVSKTPQGVSQVGRFVCGPLGLIESACIRYIPPQRSIVLWHCSDPGCRSPHFVDLLPAEVPIIRTIREMHKALETQLGPASEWARPLAHELGRDIPCQPYTYFDTCSAIADCIVGNERSSLVADALCTSSGIQLREILGRPPRNKAASRGAPEALAKSLGEEERLQLLFLLSDNDLVRLIDQCIKRGAIEIPLTEKRKTRLVPPAHSGTPTSELSSLGMRCSGAEPLIDLCALIWEEYSSSGRISELDWRLHNRLATGTQNMLLDYLCKNDPALALKELVLASEPITKGICEKLNFAVEDLNEGNFVDRMLWKLGFDITRFSDTLTLLRRRLESLSQELLAVGTFRDERDRERIRGAGVNLFVSVEEFLEKMICFNVWLLSSDHFMGTRFRFDGNVARRKVSEVLGGTIISGDTTVAWSVEKRNTLGTLMTYLAAASNWMKGLASGQREPLLRPDSDMPDFADNTLRVFPFRHVQLWADSDLGCLERLTKDFASVVGKILRSNLAAIRNGIDHQRDESTFPKIDEILAFVAHLREAIDFADINRFFPKEFWLERTDSDRFDRQEFQFKDYLGRSHVFYGPSFVHGILNVESKNPVIISPGNLIGYANAEMIFKLRETSVYSRYWDGYPRRRQIPIGSKPAALAEAPNDEFPHVSNS